MTSPTETAATVTVGQPVPTDTDLDPDIEDDDDDIVARHRVKRHGARRQAAAATAGETAVPDAAPRATGPGTGLGGSTDQAALATTGLDPDAEDDDDDIVLRAVAKRQAAHQPATATGGRWGFRWLLVGAVMVGVAAGAWYAGRATAPTAEVTDTVTDALAEQASQVGQDLATATAAADNSTRLTELAAILATNPDDTDALLEQGVLLYEDGYFEAAGAAWLHVTDLVPEQAEAWFNLGFYYLSIDPIDTAAAKAAWEKVVEIDPDSELAATASTHLTGLLVEVAASASAAAEATP
ncbi:MAG: hypothetical protein LBR19_03900 [Bifidobacteriaceae bacterium]|jgi:hypothetical protein|nr:hypothetical protein [Bifidobacteriaceae bacterium]